MTRYKIIIEYDGTQFVGWQAQSDLQSVQSSIEDAIFRLTKEQTLVYGSGRTDKGVHAFGQVAHFDLEKKYTLTQMAASLNHFLKPLPISILECSEVSNDFHARFCAKKRYYKYIILNRPSPPAIYMHKVWHVKANLDIEQMQQAADYLEGHHDFTSFRSSICQSPSPVKTLDRIIITKQGEIINFELVSKSFLHHMVRNIVGTLKLVGEGKISPEDVKNILDAKDRTKAGMNCPASGLYFMKVDY